MYDHVNIDKFNGTAFIKLDGVQHLFSSCENFINYSENKFDDVMIIVYEPVMNNYHVIKVGGEGFSGEDLPEIQWIKNNKEKLIQYAYQDGYGAIQEIPIEQVRNSKLFATDWMVIRHRDEIEMNLPTSLNPTQYSNLLKYRQELRDITKIYKNLDDVIWPLLDL